MGQPPFHQFLAGPGAQTCVKSGYIDGDEHYVIKVAAGGVQENEQKGLPVNSGLMLLFSQRTTRLEAIFFDEGLLTEIRTAAAAALAARILGPCDTALQEIGMIGAGVQARWQLRLLKAVTPCRQGLVCARDASHLRQFCEDMASEGWDAQTATAEEITRRCQLIHTSTGSRSPVLKYEWFSNHHSSGVHINAMGSDVPGKQELDTALVAGADLLVADSLAQTFERGEYQHALKQGSIQASSVMEIGALLDTPKLHRTDADNRLTIFDSSGVAVQDVMITKMVYEALVAPKASL
jgi:ornithine cyclodeaminase